jgi:hypothetical protein
MTPTVARLHLADVVCRLSCCPYAAALANDMDRMRHLMWRTVPFRGASPCCIVIDRKDDRDLQARVMKLLNAMKVVPDVATASESDAVSWLMADASRLSALATAAGCSVPANSKEVER